MANLKKLKPKKVNKEGSENKKKVVIFAESPTYYEQKYNLFSPYFKAEDLPKELKEIYDKYVKAKDEYEKYSESPFSEDNPDLYSLNQSVHGFYRDFENHPLNTFGERQDPTFKIEGNKLKNYYNKQGIDAEVLPIYDKDSSAIKEKIASLRPQDDVALLGHSGDRMGGLSLEWWNENLSKGQQENCYLGTCHGKSSVAPNLPDVKNVHSTVDEAWWGVNPGGQDLINALYSIKGEDTISPQPIIGQDYMLSNPSGKPGRLGFDIPNYAKGGSIMTSLNKLKPKKVSREDPEKYTGPLPASYSPIGRQAPILSQTNDSQYNLDEYWEQEMQLQERANWVKDFGTTVATMGTQFRRPTQAELEQGRSGVKDQVDILAKSAAWGLSNLMMGELSGKVLSKIPKSLKLKAIKRSYPKISNKEIETSVDKLYRSVYLDDALEQDLSKKFNTESREELLDVLGATIPGNTGTYRKRAFDQTLFLVDDPSLAKAHLNKYTNPNALAKVPMPDPKTGRKYLLEVNPNPNVKNISQFKQQELYRKSPLTSEGYKSKELTSDLLEQLGPENIYRYDHINPEEFGGDRIIHFIGEEGKRMGSVTGIQQFKQGGDVMINLKKLKRKKRMPDGGMVGITDDKFKEGYAVGTPLKEIYNVPADYSDYQKLLSAGPTKDAMNRTRWANFEGKMTDYPEGRSVPSFRYTPAMNKELEARGMNRDYIESWQPSNYPEEFGLGGILGETAIGAGTGALGGAAIGGIGAIPGAIIGGGVGLVKGLAGHFGEEAEADELAEDYVVPQGLASQHYQRAAGGGDLTEFTGERHENGGIALGGLPVEVEGGETRTNDMIHSDRIKLTSAMIKKYPVLKKSDKGKTMAEITKREHKKFEKREFDELNDNAAEIAMMPFELISEELSGQTDNTFEDGGDISAAKAREILSHGAIRGKPITDKQRRFFGAKTNAADGFDLQTLGKFAPLITSGVDLAGSLIGGPEEVDYGKTSVAPTKVNYASAEPGVQRIRRTFGSAESKLRRYNPNRYMARMGELTAREADAVTGHAGQIQTLNTQAANRANILDASNAARVNMFNKQTSIREAEANAANRAAWQGRMSANLANIGTMSGQMARDERLQESSDAARGRYFDILEEQNRILGGYGDVNPEEEDIFTNVDPLSATPNYPLYARGGSLTHRLRLTNFKSA